MPIRFEKHKSGQFYITKWEGPINDVELVPSYVDFYAAFQKKDDWDPGLHELADLSDADLSKATPEGFGELSRWADIFHRQCGVLKKKTAVFLSEQNSIIPPFFYKMWTAFSPEHVKLFWNMAEAVDWLTEQDKTGPNKAAGG